MASGKARSFRLTKENEIRLEELIKNMDLDNANLCFNEIIKNYWLFKKYEKVIEAIKIIKEEL